ncbi:hypothetical protein B7P43_G09423 [Cryptotermes secundus]|uniref:Ig-like domain-containing protein n=1 Tax=Cryptotermes secundus TaxID=105785 RepID=A0A2J7R4U5_9NEOP|nr:hypothetical protein B7P43_G09423 [Cryptotermes secundus]
MDTDSTPGNAIRLQTQRKRLVLSLLECGLSRRERFSAFTFSCSLRVCRIHLFFKTVPPRKLTILDENGTNVQQKRVIGPYIEGSTAQITCVASGGRPTPRVTWWRDGIEIDNSDEALSERRVKNVLRLENLERRHLNTVLTCKASNNDMVSPLSANITLDMYREY